jgi:hypothetical protein
MALESDVEEPDKSPILSTRPEFLKSHHIRDFVHEMNDFDRLKSHIEMTITAEGLRIELMEGATGTFSDSGSPQLNSDGRELLVKLAQELG